MNQNYEKLFQYCSTPSAPEGLLDKIMDGISRQQRSFISKLKLAIFSLGLVGSLTALFPVFKMVQSSMAETGFFQFVSLMFTDSQYVVSYWQNFTMSLLQSLPVINLAIFLAVIFIFLESLKFFVRNLRNFHIARKLIHN